MRTYLFFLPPLGSFLILQCTLAALEHVSNLFDVCIKSAFQLIMVSLSNAGLLQTSVLQALTTASAETNRYHASVIEAGRGLDMPIEFFNGLERQCRLLRLMAEQVADVTAHTDINLLDRWLFAKARDAWSLHPTNVAMLLLIQELFTSFSGDSAQNLRKDIDGQVVHLHVSCHGRVEKAQESIRSFGSDHPNQVHVVVVGMSGKEMPGFDFSYADHSLTLSVPDDYESHATKCLHAFTILSLLSSPTLVFKYDDDIRLASGKKLNAHIQYILKSSVNYIGTACTGAPAYLNMWHGWHLGKCHDPRYEQQGHQTPVPTRYADGGFSYAIGGQALHEIARSYLIHRSLMEAPTIMFEDVAVGLFLQLAGIELESVDPYATGITSERHELHRRLSATMAKFYGRLNNG